MCFKEHGGLRTKTAAPVPRSLLVRLFGFDSGDRDSALRSLTKSSMPIVTVGSSPRSGAFDLAVIGATLVHGPLNGSFQLVLIVVGKRNKAERLQAP
jgi:hypothetical protein